MTTNTPRTDAIEFQNCPPQPEEMLKKHEDAYALSRELERELLTARNDAFNLANALSKAEAEAERLREQLESTKKIAVKFWKVLEANGFKMELPK